MTALNLGDATRTLTPPGSSFTTVPFGEQTLAITSGPSPHAVTTVDGYDAIPLGGSHTTLGIGGSDYADPPTGGYAVFFALANTASLDDFYTAILRSAFGEGLQINADGVVAAFAFDSGSGQVALTDLAFTASSGITIFGLTIDSSAMRVATLDDGVIGTGPGQPSPGSRTVGFEAYTPVALLGAWEFDDVATDETTLLDTITAIASLFGLGPIGAHAAGGWGIDATGDAVLDSTDYDPPDIVPPTPGGSQDVPEPPEPASPATLVAAGMYPIRHVWERMAAPTIEDGRPVDWQAEASGNAEYAFLQIVVEGEDITVYDGVPTPFPQWRRARPFGAQSATIELPQVTTFHPTPTWARIGANVSVRLVPLVGDPISLFEGFVMDIGRREDSGDFTLECHGVLFGADLVLHPPGFSTSPQDIGKLIPSLLNAVPGRRYGSTAKVNTGITTAVAGGWEQLLTGFIQEVLATALDSSSRQWTVDCFERTPILHKKDTTTIATSVRTGQRGIDIDLNKDQSQAANVIYGEGIHPNGGQWRNAKYPNWKPDDTPAYPNSSPSNTIHQGDKDSDTDSGHGVSDFQRKLGLKVTGYYSASDVGAVKRYQKRAGITVDGIVGPQTWAAIFGTGSNTGTLNGAFIAPLAAAEEVMPRLYGPDGDDLGPNPAYDPDIIRVERKIAYGQGVTRARGVADAERTLARESDPGWTGTITFTGDPEEMSKYELHEGHNIEVLDWFGEDIVVQAVTARYDEQQVELEVDQHARDYPTLQAIMTRDENAKDPAKIARQRLLAGDVATDRPTFDAESPAGRLPKHAVFSNLWDVRRIPMGAFGTVVRTRFTTTGSASPFALAVFGKSITASKLLSVVGNPLTATNNPWAEFGDELDDLGLLQSWGWKSQPAGYYPGVYSNPAVDHDADPVTGRLVDDASWDYASASSPWLWVATIASSSCYVEGRFYGAPSEFL